MGRPNPHPAKAVLSSRRITIRQASSHVEVNEHTLGRVLNGYVEPWPALRARLAAYLDLPEVALFHQSRSSADAS